MIRFILFFCFLLFSSAASATPLKITVASDLLRNAGRTEPVIQPREYWQGRIQKQPLGPNAWRYEIITDNIYPPLNILIDENKIQGFLLKPLMVWVPYNRQRLFSIALHPQKKDQNVVGIARETEHTDISQLEKESLFKYFQIFDYGFSRVMGYCSIQKMWEAPPSKADILIVFKYIQTKLHLAELLILDENPEELNSAYVWMDYVKAAYPERFRKALASGTGAESQYNQIVNLKKGIKNKILEEMWETISCEKNNQKKLELLIDYQNLVDSFVSEDEYNYFNNHSNVLSNGIILSTTAHALSKVIKDNCPISGNTPKYQLRPEDKSKVSTLISKIDTALNNNIEPDYHRAMRHDKEWFLKNTNYDE